MRLTHNKVSESDIRELVVVRPARGGVDEAASDARDEEVVVDEQLDGMLELLVLLLEHGVELLGLGDGTGEAVEDESTREYEGSASCSEVVPGH